MSRSEESAIGACATTFWFPRKVSKINSVTRHRSKIWNQLIKRPLCLLTVAKNEKAEGKKLDKGQVNLPIQSFSNPVGRSALS